MDETLEEIEQVSNEYTSVATMTTRVFFTLDSLSQVHYLYQYSLYEGHPGGEGDRFLAGGEG